jgi:hypothetical protein
MLMCARSQFKEFDFPKRITLKKMMKSYKDNLLLAI